MKFYIPFGDWSYDGHGMYENVLVEAESMDRLKEAIIKIKTKYGRDFFHDFANEYDNPTISKTILDALIETNYSLEDFLETDEYNVSEEDKKEIQEKGIKYFKDFVSFKGWISENGSEISNEVYFDLVTIEHMYIHLLNAFGAGITMLEKHPLFTYETVGYGCFVN